MITPLAGYVFIQAETRLEAFQREIDKRIPGFEVATPKHQGAPERGTIKYIGAGVDTVKVGDRVQFVFDGKRGFEFEGEKLLKVKIGDVLAIIEGE